MKPLNVVIFGPSSDDSDEWIGPSSDEWIYLSSFTSLFPGMPKENAQRMVGGFGLPEARVASDCERAGIHIIREKATTSIEEEIAVPLWAAIVCGSMANPRTRVQALKKGRDDQSWRDALLSVWRVAGRTEEILYWITGTL